MSSALSERLRRFGHRLAPTEVAQLETFISLVQSYGTRFNLVGNLDREFLENDLVCGSLEALQLGTPSGTVVDVGSGAGFPGIPLAIAVPEADFVLIESRKKRAAFLERVARELGLGHVSVRHEDVNRVGSETFDWAMARAFAPPERWLELARRLVHESGRVCVFSTQQAWTTVDCRGWRVVAEARDRSRSDRVVLCLSKSLDSE